MIYSLADDESHPAVTPSIRQQQWGKMGGRGHKAKEGNPVAALSDDVAVDEIVEEPIVTALVIEDAITPAPTHTPTTKVILTCVVCHTTRSYAPSRAPQYKQSYCSNKCKKVAESRVYSIRETIAALHKLKPITEVDAFVIQRTITMLEEELANVPTC